MKIDQRAMPELFRDLVKKPLVKRQLFIEVLSNDIIDFDVNVTPIPNSPRRAGDQLINPFCLRVGKVDYLLVLVQLINLIMIPPAGSVLQQPIRD